MIKPGDILLCPFPQTDLTAGKLRPVIVVSEESFNRGPDVIVVCVTSKARPRSVRISGDHSRFHETGLKKDSYALPGKLATIEQRILQRRLGVLPEDLLAELRHGLAQLLTEA